MSCYVLNKMEGGVIEEVLRTSYQMMMDAKKKHKNLFMAWVDFCKAHDLVPHDWIILFETV